MAHLGSFRKGWENENLACFILSKFSFISQPVTIADDCGSDFFCTIFQRKKGNGCEYLIPKNSFAIQIKSNYETFDITNKIDYLESLEIPFFVGVADQKELKLSIYSGEYIPILFSYVGLPKKLEIILEKKEMILK